ncbi:MAG: hypothetical protein C0408_06695, partial [Odoribacter sp.]|nr:hypothetical protein [Odoribacter sp.]
ILKVRTMLSGTATYSISGLMYKDYMTRRLLILFFIFLWILPLTQAQDLNKDNQLRNLVREFRQAEVIIPYPGAEAMDIITRKVSITSVRDKKVFITISPLTIDWFIAANYNYSILERADTKGIVSASSMKQAMEWQSYPTYLQYDSIVRTFAKTYPSLCHLDSIGTSINGRKIFALKISDNTGINEDEPEVFYSSTMHGDELAGYVLMLRLADYLLKNYNLDTRVKNMVDNLEIWINPLANPDGTYTSGNTITSPTRSNANGYDLNRNFPEPPYTAYVPEKENLGMITFLRKHKFVLSANFHSGAEVVNYPWDKWYSIFHADDAWFNYVSRAYADTVHIYSGPVYLSSFDNGVTRGAAWYVIHGGRQDFVTYELQGREVTIEIDDVKWTPAAQLELLWQYNWRSLLGYLENALYGVHGFVKDLDTAEPVPAKIFITGHDKDSSHIYSDTLSGRFIRMLAPGTWNLTFSAKGYGDTTIYNVLVIPGMKTELTVEMKSIITDIDTSRRDEPLLYPNPASSYLKAKLPENLEGRVNIIIISQSGVKVADYSRDFLFGYPLEIDVRGLSGGGYTVIFTNTLSGVSYRSRFIVYGKSF